MSRLDTVSIIEVGKGHHRTRDLWAWSFLTYLDESTAQWRIRGGGGGGVLEHPEHPPKAQEFNMPKPVSLAIDCFTWI